MRKWALITAWISQRGRRDKDVFCELNYELRYEIKRCWTGILFVVGATSADISVSFLAIKTKYKQCVAL